MKSLFLKLLPLIAFLSTTAAHSQSKEKFVFPVREGYKQFVVSSQAIPLPNGVQLSAVVVRHQGDSLPNPVLLVANCYPQSYADASAVKRGLRKGYTGVVVYSRGKESSTGTFEPFEHEATDLYAVIDWISKQPWCNGTVGMFGGSYLGFVQWAALKNPHPALKTIVPQVAVAPGIDYPMSSGVFMPYMLRWLNYTTNAKLNDINNFSDSAYWKTLYKRYHQNGLPFNRLDSIDGKPDSIFQRWLQHPDYDSFWAKMIPSTPAEYSAINIPILTITGYFDADQLGALHYYNMHNRYGNSQAVANHYLLIGPWDHGGAQGYPSKTIGGYTVDSAAVIPIIEVVMDWFDHVFKGKPLPTALKDRINYFVMGDGWGHAASLQTLNTDTLRFYLDTITTNGFYSLSPKKRKNTASLTIRYNPADATAFDDTTTQNLLPLAKEQPKNSKALVFQTAPLPNDIDITGVPFADLFLSTTAADIDLACEFYEVLPDRSLFRLSAGVQRASYLADRRRRQLITPGKPVAYHLTNNFFTAKRIRKGSAIRFVIEPLNNPYWQKNYGSGKAVSTETVADAKPAMLKLFTGSVYGSSISLPCNIIHQKQ